MSEWRYRALASMNTSVFSGTQILLVALYPFIAEKLGLGLSSVILCFSLGSFLFLFGIPHWSGRSDQWGRVKTLRIGSAGLMAAFALLFLLVLAPFDSAWANLFILLLSRVLYGLTASALAPVSQALQADMAQGQKQKAMFLHTMSLSFGRFTSLSLLLLFKNQILYLLGFFLFLMLIVFLNNLFSAEEVSKIRTEAQISTWKAEFQKIPWVFAIAFVFTTFIETLNSSLAGQIMTGLSLSSGEAAHLTALVLLFGSLGVFGMQLLGKYLKRLSWSLGMLIGVSSLLMGSVLYSTSFSKLELFMAMGLFVIGLAWIPALYLSVLHQTSDAFTYGRRAGLVGIAHTLGYVAGGALTAFTLRFLEIPVGFLLFASGLILGFLVFVQSRSSLLDERRLA